MGLVKYFLIYSVCAAALAVVVHGTTCVKCDDAKGCNDPVSLNETTNCTTKPNEVCGKYSFKNSNGTKTVRSCMLNDTNCATLKGNLRNNITDGSTWNCYMCTSDLCNKESSASIFGLSMITLVVGAVLSLHLK